MLQKAYQAIVDAINAADDASRAALESAIEALEFVSVKFLRKIKQQQ